MPTLLDKVRTALKRPTPTTDQLAAAVDDARRAEADALAAVDKAQAVVTAGFMDDAAKRQADRNALAAAREGAEDAGLVRAEVERRHAAALDREEQERRRGLYDAAKAEADAAALALSKTYPTLVRGMVAMLRDLAKAQQAVALVNGQLPDGAVPLDDPELSARGVAGLPREVVSDEWIEAWARLDMNEPAADQTVIYDCGDGWGRRPGDAQAAFRKRQFRKVVSRDPVNADYPLPLAAAIQLPAVRGSGVLWGDPFPVLTPGLGLAVSGQADPDAVLARLADLDAAATAKPVKVDRALKVEWVSHIDVVPLPPEVVDTSPSARGRDAKGSRFSASPFAAPGRAGARR